MSALARVRFTGDESQLIRGCGTAGAEIFILSQRPPPVGTPLELAIELRGGRCITAGVLVVSHGRCDRGLGYRVRLIRTGEGVEDKTTVGDAMTLERLRGLCAAPGGEDEREVLAKAASRKPGPLPNEVSDADILAELPEETWAGGLRPFDIVRNYRLVDRLGVGGMAEVFLAHASLGSGVEKLVALKMVLPEFGPETRFGAMFLNEARISATLAHANLVQVFDFGEANGRPFLAMEYLQGWPISRLVAALAARGERPPPAFGVEVALQVCRALEYVHGKRDMDDRPLRLVHRDVSAGNVFITENGEVKLLDFGAVCATVEEGQKAAQVVVGTRGYIAPEQFQGAPPSPSWDVYSLGVLLYQMLAGAPPGLRTTASGPGMPVSSDLPLPSLSNPAVPRDLDVFVLAATAREPACRPGSATEMRLRLEEMHRALGPCDLEAFGARLLGEQLACRKANLQERVAAARKRSRPWGPGELLVRPLHSVRRRLAGSRLWLGASRHPTLVRVGGSLLIAGLTAAVWAGVTAWQREQAFLDRLARADQAVEASRLVGPGGTSALDLLLAARSLSPADERVRTRLGRLADTFQWLAGNAEARGDWAEAAMHLQAALRADPSRTELEERARRLEGRVPDLASGRPKRVSGNGQGP